MSIDFYHSAELRWFLPGQNQWDYKLHWFGLQGRLPINEEGQYEPRAATEPFIKLEQERIDEYLLMPRCDTVGVKQRQGRLEVKANIDHPRPFVLATAAGRKDQWVKWSFTPSEVIKGQFEIDLDLSGSWFKVAKRRYLQKISLDSGGPVLESPDVFPVTGCNVELTLININATIGSWLTLGFEAFGPSDRIMSLLDEAVEYFFTNHGPAPIHLEERDSLSYPGWLVLLGK